MKIYLKQLKRDIVVMGLKGFTSDTNIFEEWDLNHVEFVGNDNEFHNCANNLAEAGFYDRACQLLEQGIEQYPNNSDLLADYLSFGTRCNQSKRCDLYYMTLDSMPDRRKTWRAFTFLIDYLIYKINNENDEEKIEKIKIAALDLVNRFKKIYPKEELAYLSEYEVFKATFDKEEGLRRLGRFLDDNNRIVKVAPKCHLCYIDEMLESGEYEKVILYACDGAAEAAQEQEGVDTGYFFYALALAKDALWLKPEEGNENEDKEAARTILKYYQTAYDTLDIDKTSYIKMIQKRYCIISNMAGLDQKLNTWRKEYFQV